MNVKELLDLAGGKLEKVDPETVERCLDLTEEIRSYAAAPIDPYTLDEELQKLPSYQAVLAEIIPIYSYLRDVLKEKCGYVASELDEEIRSRFESEGRRVTEKLIENEILRDPSYRDIRSMYLKAKYVCDVLNGLEKVLKERRDSIESLGDLFAHGYWSLQDVKTSETLRREFLKKEAEATEKAMEGKDYYGEDG